MAMAGRLRSTLPFLRRAIADSVDRSAVSKAILVNPVISSRSYATAPAKKQEVKVPLTMFGVTGNYASALYLAAVKANALDKVESELRDFMEAAKKSPTFSDFMKDPTVKKDLRVKVMMDIADSAKFGKITKNFLAVAAEQGRLGLLEHIFQRFSDQTMAHRGEVQVTVTSAIPFPEEQEQELMETLQEILGEGKKPKVQHKTDTSILGGIVIEFDQKVFDMSISTRARQMEAFLRQPIDMD